MFGHLVWWSPNCCRICSGQRLYDENGLAQEARILESVRKVIRITALQRYSALSPETVRWHKRRLNRKLAESQALRYNLATGNDPGTEASERQGSPIHRTATPWFLRSPSRRASLPKQPVQNV